jgi:uncharacterized protein YbjT (DUF2867 family)
VTQQVLVAGGSGRLGTLVVQALATRGAAVRVLTRDPARALHLAGDRVEVVAGDVREPKSLAAATEGVDVVVSAVQGFAGPGHGSPASVDRDGNIHLIDAARTNGADFVLMSVVGAAADSPFELFRMKFQAETYLATSGVSATVVRATAFTELWIELLRRTAGRANRPLVFGRGHNPINFVSVIDVADLVDRVVNDPSTRGQTLEIGGPQNVTLNELARDVAATLDHPGKPRHVPRAALHAMAATVGRLRPELGRQARAALAMDRTDLTFDNDASRLPYADLPCTSLAQVLSRCRTA